MGNIINYDTFGVFDDDDELMRQVIILMYKKRQI